MHVKIIIWQKLFFLFVVQFLSAQAFADCPTACDVEHSNCQKAATSQEQKNGTVESNKICRAVEGRPEKRACNGQVQPRSFRYKFQARGIKRHGDGRIDFCCGGRSSLHLCPRLRHKIIRRTSRQLCRHIRARFKWSCL